MLAVIDSAAGPTPPARTPGALQVEDLARRASYLWERVAASPSDQNRWAEPAVQRRLQVWRQRLAAAPLDPRRALRRRLAWDGLDERRAALLLSESCPSPWAQLPGWVQTIVELSAAWRLSDGVDAADGTAAAAAESASGALAQVPFADLLLPLVALARARLLRNLSAAASAATASPLSAPAQLQLESALLQRLVEVAAPTLDHEFEARLGAGERLLRRFGPLDTAAGKQRYRAFVDGIRADGGAALLQRFPVLARLLATVIDQWVLTAAELVERLRRDQSLLERQFAAAGAVPGQVVALRAACADAHRGGRSTVLLRFESGLRLVYKPRSLSLDVAYNGLLDWCNARCGLLPMQTTRVLDRGDYGWCAFVAHQPCAGPAAVARFYRRTGQLLALMHLLRGTDAHLENLIADGEHPVLIDTETLCHPDLRPGDMLASPTGAETSVLRTGLLPDFDAGDNHGWAGDTSGLSWADDPDAAESCELWAAVNTDAMTLRPATLRRGSAHAPRCDGHSARPQDFEPELQAGFSAMYRFLAGQRDSLRASDGPLAGWRGQAVRYVFRDTEVYAATLAHALRPAALGNGADFSIELERLGCVFLRSATAPAAWPLLAIEQIACGQLDIPLLLARTDADALHDGAGRVVPDVLDGSAWDALLLQIGALSEPALAQQAAVISASFAASRSRWGASARAEVRR